MLTVDCPSPVSSVEFITYSFSHTGSRGLENRRGLPRRDRWPVEVPCGRLRDWSALWTQPNRIVAIWETWDFLGEFNKDSSHEHVASVQSSPFTGEYGQHWSCVPKIKFLWTGVITFIIARIRTLVWCAPHTHASGIYRGKFLCASIK